MQPGEVNDALAAPPVPFRRTSPSTLELRERGPWIAVLFGMPLFLAGVYLALSLTRVLPEDIAPRPDWNVLVIALVSLSFLAMGGVMLFGRRWLTLDRSSGSVLRQQGLLVPMLNEVRSLGEFTAVVLAFDPGNSDSPVRYPVRLRAVGGRDFVVREPLQFAEARKLAEYLSRFLHLPLADTTTDHETVVRPEQAGDNLRDRLLRGEAESERQIPPVRMRSKVTESSEETIILIPGPSFPLSGVLGVVVPLVFIFGVVAVSLTKRGLAGDALLIVMLILCIPAIFFGVNLMVDGSRRRTTVRASPAGLALEQRGAWRTHTKLVSASEILDMDLSTFEGAYKSRRNPFLTSADSATANWRTTLWGWIPSRGIVVKSRREAITFGEGLPAGELQFLRSVLRKALAGARG